MESETHPTVIALIPAYQEEERIAGTVAAVRAMRVAARILVIDDGSTDQTAERARQAGADVLRLARNGGKGAALRAGLAACPGDPEDILLLLDADLGESAGDAEKLLAPILADTADLAIARFPKLSGKTGFGLVKGLARVGTWVLTRRWLDAPISGQRACRRRVLAGAPFADGYGVEVANNIAAGDAGARIVEVPVQMTHAVTGRDWHGFRHRGRQFLHIVLTLLAASLGRTGRPLISGIDPLRFACWVSAIVLCLSLGMPRGWSWLPLLLPGLLAAVLGIKLAAILSGLLGARKINYCRRFIPALGGLLILPTGLWMLYAASGDGRALLPGTYGLPAIIYPATALFLLCWMLLGLYDDLCGDVNRKGFRGHLSALLHGMLTAGGIKLLLGALLALAAASGMVALLHRPWYLIPVGALVIALSANAMNLFDLRPGRALKVFWLVIIPLIIIIGHHDAYLALLALTLLLVTLLYAPLDFAGMMMLGDTGANPLGAAIGLLLIFIMPLTGQLIAAFLLIVLHLYAERASITRTIERVRWLRWLDRLGRSDYIDDIPTTR